MALGLQVCKVSPVGPESNVGGGGFASGGEEGGKEMRGGGQAGGGQAVPTSAATFDML